MAKKVSSKTAEQRFFTVLKDAETAPVIIERYGRPRAAVVSYERYQLYEMILAHMVKQVAVDELQNAFVKTGEGRLGLANRSIKKARAFGAMLGAGGTE